MRRLLLGMVLLAACGSKPPPAAPTPPEPPPRALGESCTPGQGMAQGDCASGLFCLPQGGFCTALCPCSGDAVCGPSTTAPEMCYRRCSQDSDCSAPMTCNTDWGACAPDGMLAAKAPECNEAPLARTAFGKSLPLSAGSEPVYEPSAALSKDGDIAAVYMAGNLIKPNTLAAARLDVEKEVSLMEGDRTLSFERENHADPWLARDRTGKLYLAYLGFNGGGVPEKNMMVGLATSDDGLTWNRPVVAHDVASDCPGDAPGCLDKPMVAIGPDRTGKLDVVYVFYWSAVTRSLRATRSTDGGQTFSPSARVGDGAYADAQVTSSGRVHVIYVAASGDRMGDAENGVYYTGSADGGESFSTPTRVSSAGEAIPFFFSSPRVVVDVPRRLLYAVYTAGTPDGKWDIVLSTSRDGGASWSRLTVNDDTSCATHMMPAAALDPASGRVHIVWLDNRSGQGAVAYSSCATGGDKCSKNELVNEVPFAGFGFSRHSASTLGDYISLVADPKKKLLHAVWTQPVDDNGTARSRVFHAAARLGR